jgi:DNA polymerase III subunit epsilon
VSSHPNYIHQRQAIDWARAVLDQPDRYVILDTETTGLTDYDEVIQIGVIDPHGSVLLDRLIKPAQKKYIPRKVTAVHGITMAMLEGMPFYRDIADMVQQAVQGRTVITYNADFDRRLLVQTAGFSGGFVPPDPWECAMLQYAQFVGEWDYGRNKYRWQKLLGGDHTAVGDCVATLARIKEMAEAKRRRYSHEADVEAEDTVEGQAEPPPLPRPPREPRASRGSMSFGISISLDGGVEYFGPKPPTVEEQDAELSEEYRAKLRAYETAHSCEVKTSVDLVRFLASTYREMTEKEIQDAGTHLYQTRISGYRGRPAIRCFTLMKRMETATPKQLYGYALSLKDTLEQFTNGLPRDEEVKAEAIALKELVEECGRNELFFRSQVLWSDMWDKARAKITGIEKKSDRKKAMNEFIKKIKDLCDARSFRGLKDERERFIDYVKAQCDCGA